jgi:hypothetical protein
MWNISTNNAKVGPLFNIVEGIYDAEDPHREPKLSLRKLIRDILGYCVTYAQN